MKTPSWWKEQNAVSNMLLPVSYLYQAAGLVLQSYIRPIKLPVPLICIGNLTAGGSGKTPVALHIGTILQQKQSSAFFLSRGYGGIMKGPVLVNPKVHTAQEVGDEPLLLANVLPTVVAKNRVQGARFAIEKGAKMIVMDDGFQNPRLTKSLSILVIDGQIGFGNGRLIPAGPLRELPSLGFKRAHASIILNRSTLVPTLPKDIIKLYAKTISLEPSSLKGKKLFAFCGIAYPEKFFNAVISTGAHIVDKQDFPDHHLYTDADINKLIARALQQDAALITTTKDAIRLPPDARKCVATLDMALEFEDNPMLEGMLDFILKSNANI